MSSQDISTQNRCMLLALGQAVMCGVVTAPRDSSSCKNYKPSGFSLVLFTWDRVTSPESLSNSSSNLSQQHLITTHGENYTLFKRPEKSSSV